MKSKQLSSFSLLSVAALLTVACPTFAHHSRAMFDMTQNITYRGVVEEYRWENPHSHIVIIVGPDARDPSTVGTWNIEASSINRMVSQGWNENTLKPGEPITVVGHPSRDGSKLVLLFYALKSDGTRLDRAQNRYPLETE